MFLFTNLIITLIILGIAMILVEIYFQTGVLGYIGLSLVLVLTFYLFEIITLDITLTNILLVVGILMILAEIVLPGGIVGSFGFSTLAVTLLFYFEIVENAFVLILLWMVLNVMSVVAVRFVMNKWIGFESNKTNINEDDSIIGETAEVFADFDPNDFTGRVKFKDTVWKAGLKNRAILPQAGDTVRIISREGITLIVEKSA